MANGRIVESGASDDLAMRDGWYAMYQKIEKAGWDFT
jgi:ABC-type multidrug transport system fused ATPase/permease subunit